jgi:hypothetical protein
VAESLPSRLSLIGRSFGTDRESAECCATPMKVFIFFFLNNGSFRQISLLITVGAFKNKE